MTNLRVLLWIYLWLLIFEGALRKWIIPALDAPLLIVRDPLVIWIYFIALQRGLSFKNSFFMPNLVLAISAGLVSTLFGDGNLAVTAYGLRTDFLQIPLIFLIPQVLNKDDVIDMGRFIMTIAIPISILVLFQFRAPRDSLINKGAFFTQYGTVRPSGPFSFIPGLVSFYDVVASFLMYGYLRTGTYRGWLVGTVTAMLLLGAACSGSRSCLVTIGIVVAVAVMCVVTRGQGGQGFIIAAVVIALLYPILSSLSIFQDGATQLTQRFTDAGKVEGGTGGFVGRFFSTMLGPLANIGAVKTFGDGLGIGTNAGSAMLHGDRGFTGLSEEEWGRIMVESGPLIGLLICLFRFLLAAAIGKQAYSAYRRGNLLPILLFAGTGLLILNGQWGVPTTLGFAIFGGGLTLAACIEPDEEEYEDEYDENEHPEEETDDTSTTGTPA